MTHGYHSVSTAYNTVVQRRPSGFELNAFAGSARLPVRYYRCLPPVHAREAWDRLPSPECFSSVVTPVCHIGIQRTFLSNEFGNNILITGLKPSVELVLGRVGIFVWLLSDGFSSIFCLFSEKRATEGSGLVSHYEQKRKISDSETMSDKKADTVYGKCKPLDACVLSCTTGVRVNMWYFLT